MGWMRNAFIIFVRKSEEMRPIGELVLKWTLMIKWIEKSRI
jgi:hypothetical protein